MGDLRTTEFRAANALVDRWKENAESERQRTLDARCVADEWYQRATEQRARAQRAEQQLAFWKPAAITSMLTTLLLLVAPILKAVLTLL